MGSTRSAWTDELRQFVVDRWVGMTASQIASALGEKGFRFSRNAVVGVAHRAGVTKGQRKLAQGAPRQAKRVAEPRKTGRPPKVDAAAPPPPREPFRPRVVDITPRHLTILQLDSTTCKYECSGQDDAKLFTFCGQTVFGETPYCPGHHSLCHETVADRRRLKAVVPA